MKEFWPAGEATAIQVSIFVVYPNSALVSFFIRCLIDFSRRNHALLSWGPWIHSLQVLKTERITTASTSITNRGTKWIEIQPAVSGRYIYTAFSSGINVHRSVYLSAGVISVRECVRQTMQLTGSKKVDGNRSAGVGRWIQELAWRDFYTGILVHYPRVSMGRPYLEKYSRVVWENHQAPQDTTGVHEHHDSENFKKWKEGMTGVPIVDAAMRCLNKMGWVHNRARMIVAMYLTKDLMIDWRLGERVCMFYSVQVAYAHQLIPQVLHANIDRRRSCFKQWWMAVVR